VVLGEEHVVGGVAVERRVEVDEVDRLVRHVTAQNVEVVAAVEDVAHVAHGVRLPSATDGGNARVRRRYPLTPSSE
jgi:hypothetical protein